ncbi:MAG: 50S ribosomal protein L17 [Myxococcales bacterium]|nr:50S ribosomal protein L17 [Myxococcales bacterium]
MRHRKSGRKLNRNSSHRKAMFSNMVSSLVTHGRIETTEAKAKELRGIAERTITWSVKVNALCAKDSASLSRDEEMIVMHAKRMAGRVLKDRDALKHLFYEVAPAMAARPGGYTRVIKTRVRKGDAAPMAMIELVASAA